MFEPLHHIPRGLPWKSAPVIEVGYGLGFLKHVQELGLGREAEVSKAAADAEASL